ncbi:MAG: hypothetical protein K2M55_08615 [Muribaculaceae bacterium]|nr:hypothetical protein [Muribaculaceae bacterium]
MKINIDEPAEKVAKYLVVSFFIVLFYFSLFVILILIAKSDDYYEADIADGYYYGGLNSEYWIGYNGDTNGNRSYPGRSWLSGVATYRNTVDYILYTKTIYSFEQLNPKRLANDSESTENMPHYSHGRGVYYFILEKATCRVYGPYIYDELVDKCNELNIRIF